MPTYYRWVAKGVDLQAARIKRLQASASPRTALWIFEMGAGWRPSSGISDDRVLIAIEFHPAGETTITNRSRWIRFPGVAFVGEAQHPDSVIVKDNEPGAYGIGRNVLATLNNTIKEVRLANLQELAKALGKPTSHAQARMRLQKWG